MDWGAVVVAAVTGAVAGLLAATVAPWVQWAIEKKRGQQERRVAVVRAIRDRASEGSLPFTGPALDGSPSFQRLRGYLSADALERLVEEGPPYTKEHRLVFQRTLMDEADRLEREWRLI